MEHPQRPRSPLILAMCTLKDPETWGELERRGAPLHPSVTLSPGPLPSGGWFGPSTGPAIPPATWNTADQRQGAQVFPTCVVCLNAANAARQRVSGSPGVGLGPNPEAAPDAGCDPTRVAAAPIVGSRSGGQEEKKRHIHEPQRSLPAAPDLYSRGPREWGPFPGVPIFTGRSIPPSDRRGVSQKL